jgi:hypothetical protein
MTSPATLSVVAGRRIYNLGPGPATRASLSAPGRVAVDSHGDLFIADSGNNVVEEVTPTGKLSVVAGVVDRAGLAKPGRATSSKLDDPCAVAVDALGDLFIADWGNFVVEKVTPAGRLSVIAGVVGKPGLPTPGPAIHSEIWEPGGVAVDPHGDVFITDEGNEVVEKVTPAGRLSVVAGVFAWPPVQGPPTPGPATSSKLDSPIGVAVDAREDLFIGDHFNDVVEEVTPAGRLSVVAGNGRAGPPKPGPATSSDLDVPAGVAVDAHGDLFIADEGNDVVEKVTPAGRLSVIAGVVGKAGPPTPGSSTASRLAEPTGLALDAHGDLFIADTGNDVVEKVTPAGRLSLVAGVPDRGPPTPGPATSSELEEPSGVAMDFHGDLFIADSGNSVVEKVTPAGRLSVVAGVVGKAGSPTPGPATSSELDRPTGVAVNAHGDLFIADQLNNVVEEVTPAERLSVVAGVVGKSGRPTSGPATGSRLDDPTGVAVDTHGDLFIADFDNLVVEEVTPAGKLSVVAGEIGKAGSLTPGPATATKLDGPGGVAVDTRGDLFIADYGHDVIEQVTPAGRLSVVAGSGKLGPPTPGPANSSDLDESWGVAVDAHGELFIADYGNNVVEEVTPAGRLSVIAGVVGRVGPPTPGRATSSALNAPFAVAVNAHGDLFIADEGNNDVEQVTS